MPYLVEKPRTSSVARSHVLSIRPYVISGANRSSDLDSFVSAVFASVYGLALQDLRHRGSLLGSFRQLIAGGAGSTSLGELNLHRWGSLHGSFRLGSLGYRAGGTSGCCGEVLRIQPPQVLQSGSICIDRPMGLSVLAFAHLLCCTSCM